MSSKNVILAANDLVNRLIALYRNGRGDLICTFNQPGLLPNNKIGTVEKDVILAATS